MCVTWRGLSCGCVSRQFVWLDKALAVVVFQGGVCSLLAAAPAGNVNWKRAQPLPLSNSPGGNYGKPLGHGRTDWASKWVLDDADAPVIFLLCLAFLVCVCVACMCVFVCKGGGGGSQIFKQHFFLLPLLVVGLSPADMKYWLFMGMGPWCEHSSKSKGNEKDLKRGGGGGGRKRERGERAWTWKLYFATIVV